MAEKRPEIGETGNLEVCVATSWWLISGDKVIGAAEVADTYMARTKGLLGRTGIQGAMVFPRTRSIHTFGMKFAIDVAFLDKEMVVVAVATVPPWQLLLPRRRARMVVEAEAGSFERWNLAVGDRLELVRTAPKSAES
jgi:uncharacterized membrane protein (UPF0127 family)